ncbi:hypothetical protein AB0D42_22045 [Streptomyces sp. NPDC048304]|uniref:hypothetical protein n=1 Tax=Streptomyces sp. NPDC048304 TaxID=3154820 RepID=UPI0033CBF8DB
MLVLGAGLYSLAQSGRPVTCDGSVMHRADQCLITTDDGTEHVSHAEMERRKRTGFSSGMEYGLPMVTAGLISWGAGRRFA